MIFNFGVKKDKTNLVKAGGVFERMHAHNLIETARVLSIGVDLFGIPHVKYEVKFESSREGGRSFDGPRVLALSVFADTYEMCAEPS
jgi:hypothetical protein